MSAEAWRNETEPLELLYLLPPNFSRRKLRHYVCEWVRRYLPSHVGSGVTSILEFAERIADNERDIDADTWVAICQQLHESCQNQTYAPEGCAESLALTVGEDIYGEAHWLLEGVNSSPELEQAAALLRDIFGNPFRPVDFAPWRTDTAVSLARQMYDSREFGAMPILADALQDAGCDSDEVLSHCRGAGPHVRGCWVVDGVLGKE
jgi:hypothetical protein